MNAGGNSPLSRLDAATWARIEPIVDEALELEGAERAAFLERACAGEAPLRAIVEALLAADADAEQFLERPLAEVAPSLLAPEPDAAGEAVADAGRRFGPWETLREVGRGGMGAVYEAVRSGSDFRQRAALKVIKRGLDTDEILERFRRERRILAALEHPNIARLLDGGASEDGRPWLAMEFVEGEPITEWCDARRLGIDERLRLFLGVCDAVLHAHRALVVHRDLKPGNILVSTKGEVKLLDFGVARLLAGEGEDAEATVAGLRASALTPRYAAPEQLRGDPATTATDVYGLGLVLYELVAGRRAREGDTGSFESLARRVLERDVEAPSAAAGRAGDGAPAPEAVAACRATTAERLRRSLRGDLDAIVLTALARDPRRRYASVEALADDLRSHLANEPVRARPASRGYRLAKLVARHRLAFGAGALAVVVLAGYAITLAVLLERQREARRAAEASALEAKRTRDFLAGMLATGGMPRYTTFESMGGSTNADLRLRDVLDRAARAVDDYFAEEPNARLAMHLTLGETYQSLGESGAAETQLKLTEAQARTLGDTKTFSTANDQLFRLYEHQGKDALALEAITRAESAAAVGYGPRSREYAMMLGGHARSLLRAGRPDSAFVLATRAVEIARAQSATDSAYLCSTLGDLGRALADLGRYDEAETPLRASLDWARRNLPVEHQSVLACKSNLASVMRELGRYGEADTLYREVIAVRRRLEPGTLDLAITLNSFGMLQRDMKRYPEAESALVEASAIRTRGLGADNRLTVSTRASLAILYLRTGRAAEAARMHREILAIRRRTLGPDHPLVASSLVNLGDALAGLGRTAEAERDYRDALALRRRVLPAGHPDTRKALESLAKLYDTSGRPALAAATRADTAR